MRVVRIFGYFFLSLLAFALGAPAELSQKPLSLAVTVDSASRDAGSVSRRKLNGKFLHITDMHPDPFYKTASNTEKDKICHRGKGSAGLFGAELTDCDSPITLINATFKWIEENLKDEIDFIVWTGDSARHDNDEKIPRSEEQVLQQNKMLVDKFHEVFGVSDDEGRYPTGYSVPIIPSIGNNDMLPHNIFEQGPNRWTKLYAQMWRRFIPEEQRHGFDRGGWFYVEVIPNRLAVFSLNTMYFFGKNSAVDGCASSTEPGYEHLEWLRIQLQFMRERGVKAILTGHVPPVRSDAKELWDETCWQKFTLWNKQYRDVIVGALYGHVNIEHFMFQDFDEIDLDVVSGKKRPPQLHLKIAMEGEDDISIDAKAPNYLNSLREIWSRLPSMPTDSNVSLNQHLLSGENTATKKQLKRKREKAYNAIGGRYAERFALSLVSGSVVPNYLPSLRVFEYNTTGLEDRMLFEPVPKPPNTWYQHSDRTVDKTKKKHKFIVPPGPSATDVPGPAYSPQALSWLGYRQYFSNITEFNGGLPDDAKAPLQPLKHETEKFEYHIEYDTRHENDSYHLQSGLEVRHWLNLATTIGNYEPHQKKSSMLIAHSFIEEDEDESTGEGTPNCADAAKKHKHKKNKHHKKHKKHKKPHKKLSRKQKRQAKHAWRTFVVRGTIATTSKKELKDDYGTPPDDDDDSDD